MLSGSSNGTAVLGSRLEVTYQEITHTIRLVGMPWLSVPWETCSQRGHRTATQQVSLNSSREFTNDTTLMGADGSNDIQQRPW